MKRYASWAIPKSKSLNQTKMKPYKCILLVNCVTYEDKSIRSALVKISTELIPCFKHFSIGKMAAFFKHNFL